MLLELGADVNADNRAPERPPHCHEEECGCGNQHALQAIFGALTGGNFEREEYRKDFTPLHDAAEAGNVELAKLLLEYGAKVDAFDINDGTPLTCSVRGKKLEVCKLLLEEEGG